MSHSKLAVVLALSLYSISFAVTAQAQNRVISPQFPTRILPIDEVSYTVNGSPVTQQTEAGNGTLQQSGDISVTKVKTLSGRNLDIFNFAGAQIRDANGVFGKSSIQTSETGIGVRTVGGGNVEVENGKTTFDQALTQSTQNSNILNYVYYDGNNTTPSAAYDFDLLFLRAFNPSDAFLIQERDGNTFFGVDPLGADGNVIAGSNTLIFGGNTDLDPNSSGTRLTRYDWNSGYALNSYQSSQPFVFSVVESKQFFEGTSVALANQVVYGFRVDNNGNADVKFFGLSDDTFDNNPFNPLLIPEPSGIFCFVVAGIGFLVKRRR